MTQSYGFELETWSGSEEGCGADRAGIACANTHDSVKVRDRVDLRSVDSSSLGRRLALVINETDLARRRRTRIRLVEQ